MTCPDSIPCGHCPACVGSLHAEIAQLRADLERMRGVERAARALFLYMAPRNVANNVVLPTVAAGEFPEGWSLLLRPFFVALAKALLAVDGKPVPQILDTGRVDEPPAALPPAASQPEPSGAVEGHSPTCWLRGVVSINTASCACARKAWGGIRAVEAEQPKPPKIQRATVAVGTISGFGAAPGPEQPKEQPKPAAECEACGGSGKGYRSDAMPSGWSECVFCNGTGKKRGEAT